jgi:ADP-ribose pyrophosphatase
VNLAPDSGEVVWQGRLLGITVEHWGENEREIVEHPGAVAIVAVDGEGQVALVRQLREATRRYLLELPAGTAEPGENPLETAQRELQEECGLTGGEWREIAAFWTTPGFCRERMHLFAAEGVVRGEASPAEDEELELVYWPVAEIDDRLGEIEDAKTLAGLLLYLRTLVSATDGGPDSLHRDKRGSERQKTLEPPQSRENRTAD